jgi:hypothetical protein
MEVGQACLSLSLRVLIARILLVQRGLHDIDDELIFKNHTGYIFHDSRGFEAGGQDELKIVQDFVRRKSQEERLNDRLHAIWFVSSGICLKFRKVGSQVLHPDGQRPTVARFEAFWGYLPG